MSRIRLALKNLFVYIFCMSHQFVDFALSLLRCSNKILLFFFLEHRYRPERNLGFADFLPLLKRYSIVSPCLFTPVPCCSGCFEIVNTLKICHCLCHLLTFFCIKAFCFYSFAYENIIKHIIMWFIEIANLLIRVVC